MDLELPEHVRAHVGRVRRTKAPLAPRLLLIRPTMRAVSYPGPKRLRVLDRSEPAMEHPEDAVVRVTRNAQDSLGGRRCKARAGKRARVTCAKVAGPRPAEEVEHEAD